MDLGGDSQTIGRTTAGKSNPPSRLPVPTGICNKLLEHDQDQEENPKRRIENDHHHQDGEGPEDQRHVTPHDFTGFSPLGRLSTYGPLPRMPVESPSFPPSNNPCP